MGVNDDGIVPVFPPLVQSLGNNNIPPRFAIMRASTASGATLQMQIEPPDLLPPEQCGEVQRKSRAPGESGEVLTPSLLSRR
jgi:hypothetical protein